MSYTMHTYAKTESQDCASINQRVLCINVTRFFVYEKLVDQNSSLRFSESSHLEKLVSLGTHKTWYKCIFYPHLKGNILI